ncbi:hypothetical protein Mp_2g20030 [Marchantia polymorpha subsp. ruderalis]|uniref:Uncharacterized protein n=1 Tax=Marchantia polymorpha TaxID=3197 RepID=A0A2R6WV90_MARPO|nr:hypothetical protein MARPO_0055s0046 [Marchantia polymorpha]BBN03020.1 hypothetical protein Mp_2g20030 [Marchantia polymorpha subsp. ruderalis]|eukprot:PTQ37768.1 hypothetical protein MARPO_0055s0046 [Marchantia polymorpha]
MNNLNNLELLGELGERVFATLDEARAAVDSQLQDEGFVLTIKHTRRVGNKKDGDIKAVVLYCSCGAQQPRPQPQAEAEQQQRKRVRGSRGIGCTFNCTIRRQNGTEWAVFFDDKEHNHALFADPSIHPQGRALTPAQRQEVIRLASDGLRPTRIVSTMRRQTVSLTPRDVYNLIQAERNRNLASRSPLQALLDNLERNKAEAPYFTQFDNQQRLTHLFIVSPSAKEVCSKFSARKIWLIDSTYKTNRFGLLLMHVLVARVLEQFGVIPSTFVTDRELALMNSLDNVFPDADFLLCRWHISKNITAKHRLSFDSLEAFQELLKQWNALVFSITVACYEQQLEAMQEMFPLHVMTYLETTWLVYKERFVACFLRGKLHFGHTTTSRVESAHSAMKKWISVSTVMGKISIAGLKSAFQQFKLRLENSGHACQGLFSSNLGHPCKHWFPPAIAAELKIEDALGQVHEEYNNASIYHQRVILDHIATLPTANVLTVLRGRGRPARFLERPQRATSTSTQRNPSQFEVVEASVRPQRRCGRCRQSGHNA